MTTTTPASVGRSTARGLTSRRILLIEDDRAIARLLQDNLACEGYEVAWSDTGKDAARLASQFVPDLVLLDLMLPNGVDGLDLCRYFTQSANRVPVIIVSAKAQREDRVKGLTLGADDYVIKPFGLDELLARMTAVLRRTTKRVDELRLGDTIVDFVRLRAHKSKQEIVLTHREFSILRYLAEHLGTVVSRDELLCGVWGYSEAPLTRTVDNFVFRLRHKIEPDPRHPKYIRKAYGDGYQLMLD